MTENEEKKGDRQKKSAHREKGRQRSLCMFFNMFCISKMVID